MIIRRTLNFICVSICLTLTGIHMYDTFDNFPKLLESVNLEAGSKNIYLSQFYKEGRILEDSKFLTDIKSLDLDNVGSYSVKILEIIKEKTVKLNVVDITAPIVEFKDISRGLDYEIKAEDFIESIEDYSDTTVELKSIPKITDGGEYKVIVSVKNAYGNHIEKECTLNITVMVSEYILELGTKLKKKDIILDERYYEYLSDSELKKINKYGVGEYTIKIKKDDNEFSCLIKVQDTKPPVIKLKSITITNGQKVSGKGAFIKSVEYFYSLEGTV